MKLSTIMLWFGAATAIVSGRGVQGKGLEAVPGELASLCLSSLQPLTDSIIPDCAHRCWENSKYVSDCEDDKPCYCGDLEFQSVCGHFQSPQSFDVVID
jgi:hypothetical protein